MASTASARPLLYYFGKDMDELSAGELAMLVGVVNGPGAFSPYLHYENAISRQQTCCKCSKMNR